MIKPGDQILYVPNHVDWQLNHRDTERGFVTSINDKFIFCRFWMKGKYQGLKRPIRLRTTANSEACRPEDIILCPEELLLNRKIVDKYLSVEVLEQYYIDDIYKEVSKKYHKTLKKLK